MKKPEGGRVAAILGISERNDFAMLERIGGECAGAVSLLPEDAPPPDPGDTRARMLDEPELEQIVAELPLRPLMAGREGRAECRTGILPPRRRPPVRPRPALRPRHRHGRLGQARAPGGLLPSDQIPPRAQVPAGRGPAALLLHRAAARGVHVAGPRYPGLSRRPDLQLPRDRAGALPSCLG